MIEGIEKTTTGFAVKGAATFQSVAALRKAGDLLLDQLSEAPDRYVITLCDMCNEDASSLTLLLAWMRTAKLKKIRLLFTGAPQTLMRMAALFGVQKIIPFE